MKVWKTLFASLVLIITVLGLTLVQKPDDKLHLIACDVGQGDAILVVYGQTQILIDGGPGLKVLDCLSKHLLYNDREIELVILTHPQIDHYGGLIEVFRRYKVDTFLAGALESSAQEYQVLKKEVGGSGAKLLNPGVGLILRVGKIYIDILHPSNNFMLANASYIGEVQNANTLGAYTSNKDANDFSIVAELSLGGFKALFTGDISPESEALILNEGLIQHVQYIKVPHHGSKNGLTQGFLEAATPEVAVISVGKTNRYGHPNQEILEMLQVKGIQILRTDLLGDIEIISDGKNWWFQK